MMKNNLFAINFKKDEITIVFSEKITSKVWGDFWGDVQQILAEKTYNNQKIRIAKVDMSNCIWADPLPLMSILMSELNKV